MLSCALKGHGLKSRRLIFQSKVPWLMVRHSKENSSFSFLLPDFQGLLSEM
jgi:hypothetical protein